HVASAVRGLDRRRVMGGIEHDHLFVVADDPDVVVDIPTAAVEFELAAGDDPLNRPPVHLSTTTDRSTSPRCIFSNAPSTSSSAMRSVTNGKSTRLNSS